MNELKRRGGVLTLLKGRHFKRKLTPQPRTPMAMMRSNKRHIKLKPRSHSLGSLSVIDTNSSPDRYETICTNTNNIPLPLPLRMANSIEENNNQAFMHDMQEQFIDSYSHSKMYGPYKLKRSFSYNSYNSMRIHVDIHANPNDAQINKESAILNHIYSEIDFIEHPNETSKKLGIDNKQKFDSANVMVDTLANDGKNHDMGSKNKATITQMSIDDHLDHIDQLNSALDKRLTQQKLQQQQQQYGQTLTTSNDLNVIEIAELKDKISEEPFSTWNNPNVETEMQTTKKKLQNIGENKNKKRSLSFSQKSINTLFCNIKEFSKSPLNKMHHHHYRHHHHHQSTQDLKSTSRAEESEITEDDKFSISKIPLNKSHISFECASNKSTATENASSIQLNDKDTHELEATMSERPKNWPISKHCYDKSHIKDIQTTYNNNVITTTKLKMTGPKIQKKQKKSKILRQTFHSKFTTHFQWRRANVQLCQICDKHCQIVSTKSAIDYLTESVMHSDMNADCKNYCRCPHGQQQQQNKINKKQKRSFASVPLNKHVECNRNHDNENNGNGDDGGGVTSSNIDIYSIDDHSYCVPNLAMSMSLSTNRPLYEEEWFHGVLPREEVVRLLNKEGDFLVRETIRNEESQIVLSVCWNGHKHFIVQTTVEGHFRFEGPPFPSIRELIMHQYHSELPVTVKSGAILRRPICRERWELSNDDVMLLEKIGRGNFGDVYKARLKSSSLDVAVKTCRMTLPDEQKRKFLQEGRILKQYDHPNIVKLIGICVQKQPIMIVMELVPGGSLLNNLRKNSNHLTTRQQMGMCRDAAAGMRYLESKNCIHRDLAARNCLVGIDNCVKISDFGMSREEEEYIVSDGMKQIPVKWTAPEALNFGKYTTLCDVWSYGILMWEIFSRGDTPYSGMSNSRARERIDAGYRMAAPENTPPEMYRLMLQCWSNEPDSRPHFDEIYNTVDSLILRFDNTN